MRSFHCFEKPHCTESQNLSLCCRHSADMAIVQSVSFPENLKLRNPLNLLRTICCYIGFHGNCRVTKRQSISKVYLIFLRIKMNITLGVSVYATNFRYSSSNQIRIFRKLVMSLLGTNTYHY